MAEQKTVEAAMEIVRNVGRRMGLSMQLGGRATDLMSSQIRETVART